MRPPRRRRDPSLPLLAAIATAVALASIWLALALAPANAAAAERVPVRGWTHEAFGLLVFDWPAPVGHSAHIEDGRLVIEFDRAGSFGFDRALANLGSYLSSAEPAADGRRVVMVLARPVALKSFTDGPKVVLDLTPAPAAPQPATAAPAPASTTSPAPVPMPPGDTVRVRTGEHDGFSRLVFDWPEPVDYEIARQGDIALVSFHSAGRLDMAELSRRPLRAVTSIEVSPMADRVVARLTLPAGAALRDFTSGASVVIDVTAPTSGPPPMAQPVPAPVAPPQPEPGSPQQTEIPASQPEQRQQPTQPAEAPDAAPMAPTAPAPGFASAPPVPAASTLSAGSPIQLVPPVQQVAPAQPRHVAAPEAAAAGRRTGPEESARPEIAAAPSVAPETLPVTPVAIETDENGARIQVAWPEPVAAAAFRRAGVVWLVFDRPSRLDLTDVAAAGHPALGTVSQLDHPSASILQFSGDRVATPRLAAEGTAWIADFRPREEGPLTPLEPRAGFADEDAGELRIAAEQPSLPIEVVDPEVGDRLVVVALGRQGNGIAPGREWPEFALLPTGQGIVVAPRREGVVVETSAAGVLVRRDGGLLISREAIGASPRQTASAVEGARPAPDRLFDLVAWRREGTDFAAARQELQHAIARRDGTSQNIARLDLARFYFAHGLATEAAGMIDLIARDATDEIRDPELLLLSGASQLLQDDLAAARKKLHSRALDGEREAALWRAALAAAGGEWKKASQGFAETVDLLETYPHVTRGRMLLLAAEAEIEAGDPGAAAAPLDALRKDAPTPDEAAQIAYLEGLKAEKEGRLEAAASAWRGLTGNNHQPSRARAIFRLTELMLREGKLNTAEAIERMERLRFIWRGGPFEFAVLRRLGQLYLADGRPREGLTVLRNAVAASPEHPDAQAVAGEMADAFRDIYLGGGARSVSPLLAVALYDEFRELTPAGAEGDRLVAGLAERLVEVDLLDRADKLLDDQVRYRLHGPERAQAGMRLAEIRLRDDRPEDALAALRSSSSPGLPEPLVLRRNQLQARALFETGRTAEALALLEDDPTVEGTAQRADMLWRLREWAGAAEAIESLLERSEAEAPVGLAGRRAELVLNRAIALTLAGRKAALAELAARYGEAIAGTSYAEPFKLLTDSAGDDMTTRPIAEQLASAGRLGGFLADYRDQVQTASAPGS